MLCSSLVSCAVFSLLEEVFDLVRVISVLLQYVVYLFLRFAPLEKIIEVYLSFLRAVFILLFIFPLVRYRVRVQVADVRNPVHPWVRDVNLWRPADFRLKRLDSLFHVLRSNIRASLGVGLIFPLRLLYSDGTPG